MKPDYIYLAGLFDGEGNVYYKQLKKIRHKLPGQPVHTIWYIRMEIAMTDYVAVKWVYDMVKVGFFGEKKVREGFKRQWRWRASSRQALSVAREIIPYCIVKKDKLQQIIDHYEKARKV